MNTKLKQLTAVAGLFLMTSGASYATGLLEFQMSSAQVLTDQTDYFGTSSIQAADLVKLAGLNTTQVGSLNGGQLEMIFTGSPNGVLAPNINTTTGVELGGLINFYYEAAGSGFSAAAYNTALTAAAGGTSAIWNAANGNLSATGQLVLSLNIVMSQITTGSTAQPGYNITTGFGESGVANVISQNLGLIGMPGVFTGANQFSQTATVSQQKYFGDMGFSLAGVEVQNFAQNFPITATGTGSVDYYGVPEPGSLALLGLGLVGLGVFRKKATQA